MPGAKDQITKSKVVLAEGPTDELFLAAVLKYLQKDDVQVIGYGGVDSLNGYLPGFVKESGFRYLESLAVVRDAEADADAAFQSVRSALANQNLPVPKKPCCFVDGKPRIGVYVIPDAATPGMLEDLCMRSVAECPEFECVDAFFECVKARKGSYPRQLPKARMKAFLWCQGDPRKGIGAAVSDGIFPFDHEAFAPIKQFLGAL